MKIKTILLLLALCVAAGVSAQNNEDIVDRVSRVVGVRLPDGYEAKVKEFAAKSELLKRKSAEDFTERWITGQMKTSWGIDRGNQLLFVWDAVYEQITKKNFYDGEDGNKKRLDEFEKVMDNVEACGKKYKEDFTAHMKQRSAEAERRSAEYKQQSAEAKQSMVIMAYFGLEQCVRFYQLYKQNPSAVMPNEISQMKNSTKLTIQHCKEFNIDYYSLLPTEVQSFYDVSPVQQNSLTCDKAKVKILNIVLQEIVKLYDIYQKNPQAELDIHNIKDYIKQCKRNNIDYKAILRKELGNDKKVEELLKFYGVE